MSPSPISTRRIVSTGAPCSGKTTLLEALARRGFAVVPETARALIESELRQGRTLEQIRRDPLAFQRRAPLRGCGRTSRCFWTGNC
ncbi:MAG: AAA family ATPase [Desulfococcaceae bacterium]